jgi:histidyl-tRNA synthetase
MGLQNVPVADNRPHIYFCRFGAAAEREAMKLAEQLRIEMPQLRLVLNAGGGGLKSQLKRADASGARYALILGDEETAARCVQVKSLRGEGEPNQCPWPELAAQLSARLALE